MTEELAMQHIQMLDIAVRNKKDSICQEMCREEPRRKMRPCETGKIDSMCQEKYLEVQAGILIWIYIDIVFCTSLVLE